MIDVNLKFIEKIIRKFYSICVVRILRLNLVKRNWTLNEDFSIDINDYLFLRFCRPEAIDHEGKLIVKFNYIDTFYVEKLERLTSSHNFPKHCRSITLKDSKIKELSFDRIDDWLELDNTKLKKLEIKSCGEKCFIKGNLEDIKTFAYIPICLSIIHIMTEYPFKHFTDNNYANLTFEKTPRHQIFLEFMMLVTKKEITQIVESDKADPNHFYGKLLLLMTSDRKIFGAWEKWSSQYNMIEWPEGFLDQNLKTSVESVHKFAL